MHHSQSVSINTNAQFEIEYSKKIQLLLMTTPLNRGAAHAMADDTTASTHELLHVTESFKVDTYRSAWAEVVKPNLPWADDHFAERVGGEPLNPSPSEAWWPYARQGNAEHKQDEKFSHTYPERFWPRRAGDVAYEGETWEQNPVHQGIQFEYGDLNDVLKILHQNSWSRQAYLPVWFPEDLTAARLGERVPCSMGYHFMRTADRTLDCVYTMRSCDIVRFYRDDIYMAGRLLQWVAEHTGLEPGKLVVHIDNLHCFPGDRPFLEKFVPKGELDPRQGYNFGALG